MVRLIGFVELVNVALLKRRQYTKVAISIHYFLSVMEGVEPLSARGLTWNKTRTDLPFF